MSVERGPNREIWTTIMCPGLPRPKGIFFEKSVHSKLTPKIKFIGTYLYTWVKRGNIRVKCLAQEHNAVPRPGLEPGPFYPESSALTA